MSGKENALPWVDPVFIENQGSFPKHELLKFAGQHIAWSWDGARILASDPERRMLDEKLRAAGVDPRKVIHDYVEDPDLSNLG